MNVRACLISFAFSGNPHISAVRLVSAGQGDGSAGQGDRSAGQGDGSAGQGDGSAGQGDGSAGQGDGSACMHACTFLYHSSFLMGM